MNVHDRIIDWAQKTECAYKRIEESLPEGGLPFYTQSNLSRINSDVDLFLAGINPGSGGNFKQQENNSNWKYLNENNGSHIIKGNYCCNFWDNRNCWPYWQRIKSYFRETIISSVLEDDSKFILSNASFFATKKADNIQETLLEKTMPYTLELIAITNPKIIVFFSGKKSFPRIRKIVKEHRFKYTKIFDYILIGELDGHYCIGVPHPSCWSSEQKKITRIALTVLTKFNSYYEVDVENVKKECQSIYSEKKNLLH